MTKAQLLERTVELEQKIQRLEDKNNLLLKCLDELKEKPEEVYIPSSELLQGVKTMKLYFSTTEKNVTRYNTVYALEKIINKIERLRGKNDTHDQTE